MKDPEESKKKNLEQNKKSGGITSDFQLYYKTPDTE